MRPLKLSRHSSIASASIILAASALLSRVLGLVRDRLLAGHFGTGNLIDAYQISFLLPDFIYNLFIIGALSAAFIPVFLEIYSKNKDKAWILVNQIFNLLNLGIISILVLCYIFTPQLVNILGKLSASSGIYYPPENLSLIVSLTRIMLISPLLLGISSLFTSILQSFKHFMAPAVAPIFYNLGIILGIIYLTPKFGIYGLALGVLIGAVLHLFIQIPYVISSGFSWQPIFKITPEVKKVIKLAIPRTIGLTAMQASFWISKIIAFTIGVGAVSVYYFANNLQSVPVGLFGVSIATAAFPHLAAGMNQKKQKSNFINALVSSFCQILYFTIPLSIIFLLLRAHIVRLVLGTGQFDWNATINTAQTLGFFAISIFAQSLILLLARAFYALQDAKTPVLINLGSLILNIILSLFLVRLMGVRGLALAYSIASFFDLILLIFILRLRLEHFPDTMVIKSSAKIIFASLIMGIGVYLSLRILAPLVDMHRYWGILVQAAGSAFVGITIYIFLSFILKCPEIRTIKDKLNYYFYARSNHSRL